MNPIASEYLYMTAVPVLLGGAKVAGKVAADIYFRHDITAHWFGRGFDVKLMTYGERHPLPSAIEEISTELLLQILLDFAAEQNGLLALIPCDESAEAFTSKNANRLESRYVLLPLEKSGDPLSRLIKKNY